MGSMSPSDVQIPISTNPAKPQEKQHHHNHEVANPAKAMELQSPASVHHRSSGRNSGLPCPEKDVDPFDSPNVYENLSLISRIRGLDLLLRTATFAFLVVALSSMLTSTQHSLVQVLGFSFKVSMKWSRTLPYRFLVVIEILICAYALLQFIIQSVVFVKKSRPFKRHMYLQLAADQICVYLILAASAAAAGASRMNKAGFQSLGVQDLHLPTVCSILDKFCSRATIAIIFTLLATLTSTISAALDICVYLILAASAAAAGASRMNKAGFQSLGVQDLHLPTVCSILDKFCSRATIAIIFTLLATLTSTISAALDVCLLMMAC